MANTHSSRRVHFLDELRGLCVILMVFYHAFYAVGYIFGAEIGRLLFTFFMPAEPFFAGLFVFICGICCNFSHSNLKRGLLLAAVAAALSAALYGSVRAGVLDNSSYIWFGVLHCLAVCILLYTLFYPTVRFIPPWLGLLLCAALFVCCYHIPPDEGGYFGIRSLFTVAVPHGELNNPWLYALGLCPVSPTADYFPLLPWFFCFLGGCYVGSWRHRFPRWMSRRHVPALSRIGTWSLWIYLVHQPVIYALCYAVFYLIDALK